MYFPYPSNARHLRLLSCACILALAAASQAAAETEALPYSKSELYQMGKQRTFKGDASLAAFLLGGIGTGNVSIGARGDLRDWEITHHAQKGRFIPWTFFAIRTEQADGTTVAKVLESRPNPPFSHWGGSPADWGWGLPHFAQSEMRGEYPFVWVDLKDPKMPVSVQLEAFTPFVPLDADASGIPAAVLRYKIRNTSKDKVGVSVVGSLSNESCNHDRDKAVQEYRDTDGLRGLHYACADSGKFRLKCGSMALTTSDNAVSWKREWLRGGWFDGGHDFWDDFCADGKLEAESKYTAKGVGGPQGARIGSLAISHDLAPGEEKTFEFVLSWHYPYRPRGWTLEKKGEATSKPEELVIRNYYATKFDNAWKAASFLKENLTKLEKQSREFHDTLFNSSLPSYIIDALASNITVIRSNTVFRVEDGTFFGWEGCADNWGSCHGTCTHVWNYAQTQAFLFPELERSSRRIEFNTETDAEGKMAFRNSKALSDPPWNFHAAADGQMGTIVRLYREWKLSGDTEFLRSVWPGATRALDYAFKHWDSDGDFVFDSQQHNTYDIEFYGPNSMTNSMFFAALKAGAEMADALGEPERAAKYRKALELGSAKMDQLLWGGEYYIQRLNDVNEYRYQYGQGCLSDQVLGQMLAHVAGLGYILPKDHVKQAIHSVFRYNFRKTLADHNCVQRGFAFNDESGLLLCSWPKGGRPKLPFVYSDEVWTGIEHQVAAHLIYEGLIDEGLSVVKAVRDRQDGYRRSPWDEIECGHHYARSMASWALLTGLSGFQFDMVKGTVSFKPLINQDDFRCFWSTGKAWGAFTQKKNPSTGKNEQKIEVLYGDKGAVKLVEASGK